jgi:hypothetical protein
MNPEQITITSKLMSRPRAASLFFKSCNCNSSIATRVGFAASVPIWPSLCVTNTYRVDNILFEFDVGMDNGVANSCGPLEEMER